MMVQSFWVAAVAEELFFRGYIYNLLKKVCCTTYAQMVSSLIFTFSHFNLLIKLINEGVTVQIIINYISIFVLGWCSAFIYEKRKNLIPSIVLHTCVNDFFKYFIILGIQNLSS
jgi:membrane protease YdiL (CAAX protease family)